MNTAEAILLLRKVKAHCPSQKIDEYTPEAWAEVLDGVDFRDANEAVVAICKAPLEIGKARYIEPGHIIGEVGRIRSSRIGRYGPIEIPADMDPDPFNGSEIHYLKIVRGRIASGELTRREDQPSFEDLREEVDAAMERQARAREERRALSGPNFRTPQHVEW